MVGKNLKKNILATSVVFTAGACFTACGHRSMSQVKAIYGNDDRNDISALITSDPKIRPALKVAQATFLLVDESELEKVPDQTTDQPRFKLNGRSYGETYNLCSEEPFFQQPSNGFCTGVLIGRNKILTASHCLRNQQQCAKTKLISRYEVQHHTGINLEFSLEEIFTCHSLVYRVDDQLKKQDLLIIELDRPVTGIEPIDIERAEESAQSVSMVGFPRGLPKKIVLNGNILSKTPWSALTDIDAFTGNSGSPIFNHESGRILGLLVRGEMDLFTDSHCMREKHCNLNACSGETMSLTRPLRDEIPSVAPQLQVSKATQRRLTGKNTTVKPGGIYEFNLTLKNIGATAISKGTWQLTSDNPNTFWTDGARDIGDLDWNETASNIVVKLQIGSGDSCDRPYRFRLITRTAESVTETPFIVVPGDTFEHSYIAPTSLGTSASDFLTSVSLPEINALGYLFPFIDITHPDPNALNIAVSPPAANNTSGNRRWYQQQLATRPTALRQSSRLKVLFGKDVLPFHDLNQIERPIPAGLWQLRITDFTGAPIRIEKIGLHVQSSACKKF